MDIKVIRSRKMIWIISLFIFFLSSLMPATAQTNNLNLIEKIYLPLVSSESISKSGFFYLSPTGNDHNTGKTPNLAWATFNRAWKDLHPGDTLILLDGIYYQSINPNVRNGQPGKPITIRALNDGKAIIDGEFKRKPIKLGDTWSGENPPIGNYFIIEGLIARNSSDYVVEINAAHDNIIRRVTAYNANTNTNSMVIGIIWSTSHDNLIEDCVASGSGRKMIMIYEGHHNTIRRCLVDWKAWEGRDFCGVTWPFGDGIQVYSGDYNIIENVIINGLLPNWGVSIQANDPSLTAVGNKILGTVALRTGMSSNNTVKTWGTVRPQPNSCPGMITDFNWPGWRAGFMLYGQGELSDNLFQDILAWGNAGLGLTAVPGTVFHPNNHNNTIVRATLSNNGIDNPDGPWPGQYGGKYTDAIQSTLSEFNNVQDSIIAKLFINWPNYPNSPRNLTSSNSIGAQLSNRYVDGIQTAVSLWPWPLEQRIRNELGISVTNLMAGIIPSQISPIP